MDTARGRRERPVFPGVGRELVECEPNRLRGSGLQAQLGAVHEDPRANEICEMRELGAGQVLDLYTAPHTPYQQVLIGRKRLDSLREALDEIFGIISGGLVSDRVHNAEHVLGAMIDLTHQKVHLLLALLTFGNIRNRADDARGSSLTPGALVISKPMQLYPADLAVFPPEPELDRARLRIRGIERRVGSHPEPFRVIRMHPLVDLLDRRLATSNTENFLRACIPRELALARIVMPPPHLGSIHAHLQAPLARGQVALAPAQQIPSCPP